MARSVCSLSSIVFCFVGISVRSCLEVEAVKPQVAHQSEGNLHSLNEDWANSGPTRRQNRKNAIAKAVGDIPHMAMHADSVAAPAAGPAGPAGPGGPASPAPAPGPAPAPAPLTWNEKMAKMKADMSKKVGSSFDADYVIDRPTQFPILHKEHAAGPYHDIFPDDGSVPVGPGPAPAPPGQGPSPAPMGYIPFTESSLPDDVEHNNRDTMVGNWRVEYGPHGPEEHPHVHGPYIDRPFKGWGPERPPPPPLRPWFMPNGHFGTVKTL